MYFSADSSKAVHLLQSFFDRTLVIANVPFCISIVCFSPASILYNSTAGRYRLVSYPDGPITARYRFIKNAYWVISSYGAS